MLRISQQFLPNSAVGNQVTYLWERRDDNIATGWGEVRRSSVTVLLHGAQHRLVSGRISQVGSCHVMLGESKILLLSACPSCHGRSALLYGRFTRKIPPLDFPCASHWHSLARRRQASFRTRRARMSKRIRIAMFSLHRHPWSMHVSMHVIYQKRENLEQGSDLFKPKFGIVFLVEVFNNMNGQISSVKFFYLCSAVPWLLLASNWPKWQVAWQAPMY